MGNVSDNAKGGYRRIEVLTGPVRRRKWSQDDKARIVADPRRAADRGDRLAYAGVALPGPSAAVSPVADPGAAGDRDRPRHASLMGRRGGERAEAGGGAAARDPAGLGASVRR
jgi:hypothetical protein